MLRALLSILVAALLLLACGGGGRSADGHLSILHLSPMPVADGEALVLLNQQVEVYFSEALDPLSIDEETLRVVDSEGHGIPGTRSLGLSGHSVIFTPTPPVEPDLRDGSFRPGESYHLQIAGFPRAHAIRARSGRRLQKSHRLDLRAVNEDSKRQGFPTPFQFLGTGEEPFQMAPHLEMAADSQRLRMHFNLPILPGSLRSEAFHVFRLLEGSETSQRLQPESLRILPERAEPGLHYGSTIEWIFSAVDRFDVTDKLGVWLFSEPSEPGEPRPLRDYRGRAVSVAAPQSVELRAGTRVALFSLDFATVPILPGSDPDKLSFENSQGRAQPLCRVEAGTGELGWFRPQSDVILEAGSPYLPSPGAPRLPANGNLQFLGVEIPAGVTVTLRSDRPGGLVMRSLRDIHIAGTLRIEAPTASWTRAEILATEQLPSIDRIPWVDQLLQESFVSLVASGDIRVTGHVESDPELGAGSPLSILSGGRIRLQGNLIPQVVLAVPASDGVTGPVESPIIIEAPLEIGLSQGAAYEAEAFTEWQPLDAFASGRIQIELKGLRGDLEVAAQLAPPHPVRNGEPRQDAEQLRQPTIVENGMELEVTPGWYIRFRIRAPVVGGAAELASLQRILVYAK